MCRCAWSGVYTGSLVDGCFFFRGYFRFVSIIDSREPRLGGGTAGREPTREAEGGSSLLCLLRLPCYTTAASRHTRVGVISPLREEDGGNTLRDMPRSPMLRAGPGRDTRGPVAAGDGTVWSLVCSPVRIPFQKLMAKNFLHPVTPHPDPMVSRIPPSGVFGVKG